MMSPAPGLSWSARRRAMLLERVMPWAPVVARRYVAPGRELDDLTQVAQLGAIKAVDRYDATRGDVLSYALPKMVGEVRHHLRGTWAVQLPRDLQELCTRLPSAEQHLHQQFHRPATERELARALRVSVRAVREARVAYREVRVVSWEAPVRADRDAHVAFGETIGTFDARYDRVLDRVLLLDGLRSLREAERVAITLSYFEGRSQRQIGATLGCSQMQVSRLLARGLDRLREHARLP